MYVVTGGTYSNEQLCLLILLVVRFYDWISNSDVRVTGGTHSNGTAIFTNNTGGTFNVTGFSNTMYVSVLHSNECHYIY
jgi:hypothetical protein